MFFVLVIERKNAVSYFASLAHASLISSYILVSAVAVLFW